MSSQRLWSEEIRVLGDRIAHLGLVQARELSAYLEVVHGVLERARIEVIIPDPAPPLPCEPPSFKVVLEGVQAASMKMTVCKLLRERFRLGLVEAKQWAESTPRNLAEGLSQEDAERLRKFLEDGGAQIRLIPSR